MADAYALERGSLLVNAGSTARNAARLADVLSRLAVLSLYKEVSLYPKPGLVSPIDAGSHRDMDYRMFLASINSLRHYFSEIALAGAHGSAFSRLRQLGIEAETRMLVVTGGVNTHRGAIFNLGLLCAAAAAIQGRGDHITPNTLGHVICNHWGEEILASGAVEASANDSHGQQVTSKYGVHGARHEAVAGFPAVVRYGLPAYQQAYRDTHCREAASVQALFAIMAQLDDTNIIWRAGLEGLAYVKAVAADYLATGGVMSPAWRPRAIGIHEEFVARNLSPGGAADLLGATLFMQSICH